MEGQQFVNMAVCVQNIEDMLVDIQASLKVIKSEMDAIQITDMGQIDE